jgi:glycogen operon protein
MEGPSQDASVLERRKTDLRALLSTLFVSRGTLMLCAGDEFGRTQGGNNNAYAQDNDITWLDWAGRDTELEDFVAGLAALRAETLSGEAADFVKDAEWLDLSGKMMTVAKWEDESLDGFEVRIPLGSDSSLTIRVDRQERICVFKKI